MSKYAGRASPRARGVPSEDTVKAKGQAGTVISITLGVVAFLAILLVLGSCSPVEYGNVRLVTQFGALTGTVFHEGMNWKTPFIQGTVEVPIMVRSYETSDHPESTQANYPDYTVDAQTSDGQQITVSYTVLFRIPADRAIEIVRNVGPMKMVVENVVKAHSRNLVRILAQNYKAGDLYSGVGIAEYEAEVGKALEFEYGRYGVILDSFLVRKVSFDADYVTAMEQKQIALEAVTTEKHKAEAAEYQKQQKIRDAEANAQSTKLGADAEAYSITVRGKALADNPDIIKWEFVHNLATAKWLMIPSDGLIPMLNLGE